MTVRMHSAILAITLLATVAVAAAAAGIGKTFEVPAVKSDRLPVAMVSVDTEVTVENRGDVSVVSRVPSGQL
ncbi:MAG: hypothetical protein KIS96_13585 [Bauldia sp.]|nr:hypothetical protein [Bauldia sp.]